MSDFNHVTDLLKPENQSNVQITANNDVPKPPTPTNNIVVENKDRDENFRLGLTPVDEEREPFDISTFCQELKEKSEVKNKIYAENACSISGYSIAHDCIANTVKKILNEPIPSFADKWLPIIMRTTIGTAIHDAIQENTKQFTEVEPSIKVPSIRFSGRMDALIGNNVLVEIKSCTYTDYQKIIKKQQPRKEDFIQAMTYKYILEEHLAEAQNPGVPTRTQPPALDNYNINKIQFIYVAHDVCSADVEDFGQAVEAAKNVRKQLNSRYNKFFFMTGVTLDTSSFDTTPYLEYIKNKIAAINWYIDNNKIPTKDDPFVDTKKCFFCLYQRNCELLKK